MEDERMEQNRQPEKTDVVFFSPEMLRLADQHRREQQERLENCRQAARNGDCAAAVQMGLHYFYGTGGVKKDPDKAFAWFSRTEPDDPTALYWLAVCHDNGTGVERDPVRALSCFRRVPSWAICRRCAIWACATKTGRERRKIWTGPSSATAMRRRRATLRDSAIWGPCTTSAWEWRRTMGRRPALYPSGGAATSTGAVPAGSVL